MKFSDIKSVIETCQQAFEGIPKGYTRQATALDGIAQKLGSSHGGALRVYKNKLYNFSVLDWEEAEWFCGLAGLTDHPRAVVRLVTLRSMRSAAVYYVIADRRNFTGNFEISAVFTAILDINSISE